MPSLREYHHRFGLDAEKLACGTGCDRHASRPDEPRCGDRRPIADDINVWVIQEQVEMGVAVRMAAMDLLARNRARGMKSRGTVTV